MQTNGITPNKVHILCMDYREIPGGPGHFTRIVNREMTK
jgi:hypothetical protein